MGLLVERLLHSLVKWNADKREAVLMEQQQSSGITKTQEMGPASIMSLADKKTDNLFDLKSQCTTVCEKT